MTTQLTTKNIMKPCKLSKNKTCMYKKCLNEHYSKYNSKFPKYYAGDIITICQINTVTCNKCGEECCCFQACCYNRLCWLCVDKLP